MFVSWIIIAVGIFYKMYCKLICGAFGTSVICTGFRTP